MKRILHSARFLAVAAALCLLGCTQESVPETERTWTVSAELSPVSTKVTVDTEYKLHWSKGDNVRLFALNSEISAETQLTVYDVDAGLEKAMFKGEVTMASAPTDCIFAYPYNGTSVSRTSTTYDYTSQDYTLSPYLWGKAAYTTPEINCALSHIGGTIHLTKIASNIVSVTLKGNNSEPIGQVVIDANGTATVSGATEITVSTSGTGYAYDAYINVPPVNFAKGFTIIAQTLSGETQYRSFSTADSGFDFTPANGVGKLIKIQWDDFTSFGITASATITHTKDGSGNLNGSAVTLNSFTVTGAPSKIITEYGVDLYKVTPESGTPVRVRTLTQPTSPAANTTLIDAGDWPYLPSSNTTYTLRPWCIIHGGKLYGTDTTLFSRPPTFISIVSQPIIYTSYSVYTNSKSIEGISGGATGANNLDGSSIYIINGKVSIANSILTNKNYSKIINYSYSEGKTSFKEGQNSNVTWGAHTVNSSFTFDNVNKDFESVNCHVTGLPYTAAPPTNTGAHPWSGKANKWTNEYVRLYRQTINQSFNIISDINVNVYFNAQLISRASTTYFYVYAGGVQLFNDSYYEFWGGTKPSSGTRSGTLTKTNNTVEVKGDTELSPSGENHTKVYQVSVTYR